jgi:Ferritin-like domain
LVLEYLQAAFYTEAERVGSLHGPLGQQARVVGSHERAHVKAFQHTLGRAAVKSPSFNFRGATDNPKSFRATAVAFEDLAVGAYKEQLPKLNSAQYLAAAVSIHSVEARHAAWIRDLAGIVPAPHAFDAALPDHETTQIVKDTHFVVVHAPQTSARHAPAFTG